MDFFLSWRTYGSWLPGDARGWTSRHRDRRVARDPAARLAKATLQAMPQAPVELDPTERELVDNVIREHCLIRGWHLHAINVRSNHVHLVVRADGPPQRIMGECKAWTSRRLRESGFEGERVWARQGSTRHLNSEASLRRAIHYTLYEQ